MYNITPETFAIAEQLMLAVGFIIIFQAANSILTKGVLRGGGDTKFLMIADILFLWVASVPLGALRAGVASAGVLDLHAAAHRARDQAVWCVFRLYSRKWIKRVANETFVTRPTGIARR
jgi:Na+-driven multidrug efflux pump